MNWFTDHNIPDLADPELTSRLRDAHAGDPVLREDSTRTRRIMRAVHQYARQHDQLLADPELTALLHRQLDHDPHLVETPRRTARIMRQIRAIQSPRELADPELSALLAASFAETPAMADAPGRVKRIMRRILVVGGRWSVSRWSPFGWAAGATATLAMLLLLIVSRFGALPTGPVVARYPRSNAPTPVATTAGLPQAPGPEPVISPAPETRPVIAAVPSAPRHPAHRRILAPRPPDMAGMTASPATEHSAPFSESRRVQVAAALYSTGAAAHVIGDYETAYQAYQASYEALPTPEALQASSQALQEMAQEALNSEEAPL